MLTRFKRAFNVGSLSLSETGSLGSNWGIPKFLLVFEKKSFKVFAIFLPVSDFQLRLFFRYWQICLEALVYQPCKTFYCLPHFLIEFISKIEKMILFFLEWYTKIYFLGISFHIFITSPLRSLCVSLNLFVISLLRFFFIKDVLFPVTFFFLGANLSFRSNIDKL